MRRMILGLALAVLAIGPPEPGRGPAMPRTRPRPRKSPGMLRDSGKIHDYNVGVKYKAGTVWLEGRVTSRRADERSR